MKDTEEGVDSEILETNIGEEKTEKKGVEAAWEKRGGRQRKAGGTPKDWGGKVSQRGGLIFRVHKKYGYGNL